MVSGGRYDGLVERFTGEKVPATGISIGVSRLLFGLQRLGKFKDSATQGPVVVLVLDRDRIADYQKMAQELRAAGIRAELYLGESGMKAQMKYADRRGCALRRHPGRRREGERRGADQGPGPRRHAHLDRGPRGISEEAGRGASSPCRKLSSSRPSAKSSPATRLEPWPLNRRKSSRLSKPRPRPCSTLFRRAGYEQVAPSIIQPADIFLDQIGEADPEPHLCLHRSRRRRAVPAARPDRAGVAALSRAPPEGRSAGALLL